MHNKLFAKRLDEENEKQAVQRQLITIIRHSHRLGLDWYFTETPDLRCGRKEISRTRASGVCFRISLGNKNGLRIPSGRKFGFRGIMFPLLSDDLLILKGHLEQFSKDNQAGRPRGGFLPNRYLSFDASVDFDKRVSKSLDDNLEVRRQRLQSARKIPKLRQIQVSVFERNPDVVAEALYRADGKCQKCDREAPFIRRTNNQPYLEVHHIIPLAEDGEDTVDNAIALCPNCHREMHYGK
jgi:hypothetical protein